MGEIVNLRTHRRRRDRAERAEEAERNRVRFGRTAAEKDLAKAERDRAEREQDRARLDDPTDRPAEIPSGGDPSGTA